MTAPRRREQMRLTDRDAIIRFLPRDLDVIHVEVLRTDLGECLVTTPEQTVLDLENLRRGRAVEDDVRTAILALLPRCDDATLSEIAATQRLGRALTRVRLLADTT